MDVDGFDNEVITSPIISSFACLSVFHNALRKGTPQFNSSMSQETLNSQATLLTKKPNGLIGLQNNTQNKLPVN